MNIQEPRNKTGGLKQQNIVKMEEQTIVPSYLFVLPGQPVPEEMQATTYSSTTCFQNNDKLLSLFCGFPSQTKAKVTTIQSFPIQYWPVKNDLVIGIVKIKTAQTFIIDFGAPLDGVLGGLQFDGVTKRNKPNLKVGTPVFCRVLECSKYTNSKLSCINKGVSSKNDLGELKEGFIFWITQYKHQKIQQTLLQKLGKCVKFEVCFGKNGRIWVNSGKPRNLMLIYNMFLQAAQGLEENKLAAMISMLD